VRRTRSKLGQNIFDNVHYGKAICTRSKFSESEKEKIIKLKGKKIDWGTLKTMFGASKDNLKSMIRREKIARSLPPKLKTSKSSIKGRLDLLTKQIGDINPKVSYRAIPGAVKDVVGSIFSFSSYFICTWLSLITRLLKTSWRPTIISIEKWKNPPIISGINKLKRIWNGISPELCQNISDSMKNRLKEVLQNKGNSTSY